MSYAELIWPPSVQAIERARVVLVGLGAIGLAAGRSLCDRADCELVGAVERKRALVGRDLGEVLGTSSMDVEVRGAIDDLPAAGADVALVATTSLLEDLEPTVVALVERGINVVSICEELAFPALSHPAIADRLDALARQHGVSVLGTGCNPGFLMDTLPVALSSMTQRVHRVEIGRTAEMSGYGAILQKFGLGLTLEEFDAAQVAGTVIGHIGFEQAVAALAAGLGWTLDQIDVDPVRPAFVAPRERHGLHMTVPAGAVTAVTHSARASRDGETLVDLTINFGIFEPGDPVEPEDRILLRGEQDVKIIARGGFDSFRSTVAMATNVISAAVDAPAGLLTMCDLPVRAFSSKGARRLRDVEKTAR